MSHHDHDACPEDKHEHGHEHEHHRHHGPTGPTGPIAAARVDPAGTTVTITSQTGQFVSPGTFIGVGLYAIDLVPIPGITSFTQVIPVITGRSAGPALGVADVTFAAGHATITVSIFDSATGTPASDPFYMHVALIGP